MKIPYFQDTDTLYIELNGEIRGITLEHASRGTDVGHVTMEGLAA